MSNFHLVSILALSPPLFIFVHTLLGLALMPIYGVDKWRWRAGAIEVMAGRNKDGSTRIWFKPGAQTWGLVIFCSSGFTYENEALQIHERVHILQTYLFGAFYLVTYALSFVFLFALVRLNMDWWKRIASDDDVWHAYRVIPWELWAYSKQRRIESGELIGAWGSFS